VDVDGIRLVNPGAIAGGNYLARQRLQTVARMRLGNHTLDVEHIDISAPHKPVSISIDLQAGFKAALAQTSDSLITPELEAERDWFISQIYPEAIRAALRHAMFRCLDGEQERMGAQDVLAAIRQTPGMPDEVIRQLRQRWPDER